MLVCNFYERRRFQSIKFLVDFYLFIYLFFLEIKFLIVIHKTISIIFYRF